jgi:hypothetical protein
MDDNSFLKQFFEHRLNEYLTCWRAREFSGSLPMRNVWSSVVEARRGGVNGPVWIRLKCTIYLRKNIFFMLCVSKLTNTAPINDVKLFPYTEYPIEPHVYFLNFSGANTYDSNIGFASKGNIRETKLILY